MTGSAYEATVLLNATAALVAAGTIGADAELEGWKMARESTRTGGRGSAEPIDRHHAEPAMSVLERIVAYKREEVAARKKERAWGEIDTAIRQQTRPRGFVKALREHKDQKALIAEIKKASPSKGLIREDFDTAPRWRRRTRPAARRAFRY